MTLERRSFAYVTAVEGRRVLCRIHDTHRGRTALTASGPALVVEVGARVGLRVGAQVLVAEIVALRFAEPRELRAHAVGAMASQDQPQREMETRVLGALVRGGGTESWTFRPGGLQSPPLGAEVVPLDAEELTAVATYAGDDAIDVGRSVQGDVPIRVQLDRLLSQHVAVVGSTGQGKSCLTAAFLQRLHQSYPKLACVVFDINGEYTAALSDEAGKVREGVRVTRLGQERRLHYSELGRVGLETLLMPSEKTQRPALRFGLQALPHVGWEEQAGGAYRLHATSKSATFFDDCRQVGAAPALGELDQLRKEALVTPQGAFDWPHLSALAALVAEFGALRHGNKGPERSAFDYGNVAPFVRRIQQLVDDPILAGCFDFGPRHDYAWAPSPFDSARTSLVDEFFSGHASWNTSPWRVHILDLTRVPQLELPAVTGALLDAFIVELMSKGPGAWHPTLLVLEEAHHYIRRHGAAAEDGGVGLLPYERLAKEGRKFGVSMWLSTQRPSELSPTVLAQCGTWFSLRLSASADLERVRSASEWSDRGLMDRIPALPVQEAIGFGAAFHAPTHMRLPTAAPLPRSENPAFHAEWSK